MARTPPTSKSYMQYQFRVNRALREIEKCMHFMELQRGWKTYAKQYPERVESAQLLLEKALKTLQESAYAFFGGKVEITIVG
jgi:hypothetical protein